MSIKSSSNTLFTKLLLASLLYAIVHGQRRHCRAGTGRDENGFCVDCKPGFFRGFSAPTEVCTPCPPGTFVPFSFARFCRPCKVGTYNGESGRSTPCERCPKRSVALVKGSTECRASCRSGCMACPPGSGVDPSTGKCTLCPVGKVSFAFSATSCFSCVGNTVANKEKTACVCKKGHLNNSECEQCPAGATSPDGVRCVCAEGQRLTDKGSRFASCQCPLGTKPVTDERCEKCKEEEFVTNSDCRFCRAGTEQVGRFKCRSCRGTTFKDTVGTGKCKECPPGLVSSFSGDKCTCPNGQGRTGGGPCEPCKAGFSRDAHSGDEECRICRGSISPREGAKTCKYCRGGLQPNKPEGGIKCVEGNK